MTRNSREARHNQVDGSEYDEADLQRQLCAMLRIAINDGYCVDHAKERLVEHLADQIAGYCQQEPSSEGGLDDTRESYVDVAIHLFNAPDFELQDYELTGQDIREYAAALSGWLGTVAEALDKLINDGWTLEVVKSNVEARHPEVRTCQEAVERLGRLQIEEAIMLNIDIAEFSAEGERLSPV